MIALSRRHLCKLALGAPLLISRPVRADPMPPAKNLRFIVSRNGSHIGTHQITFEQAGPELVAHIDVQLRVGLGPLTFFRYHHQGEERWRDGKFISLHTETDDDGEALSVHAQRMNDHIRVISNTLAPQDLPATALPLTHWNVACMHAPLFNPQDGTVLHDQSMPKGNEMTALANGTQIPTTHYALAGKSPIDDWYDNKQVWTALRATVNDGSILHYIREA